jgi:hypothetical protein
MIGELQRLLQSSPLPEAFEASPFPLAHHSHLRTLDVGRPRARRPKSKSTCLFKRWRFAITYGRPWGPGETLEFAIGTLCLDTGLVYDIGTARAIAGDVSCGCFILLYQIMPPCEHPPSSGLSKRPDVNSNGG